MGDLLVLLLRALLEMNYSSGRKVMRFIITCDALFPH